ncbi:solute:sodium symporter family transporter [Aquimarina sp. BL5]|uniref:solute:sodium symporter family transporter n=1 Tax=Aquimarina sp. BL5 TaxID=1714860 RepID=UPI000E5268EC|nr:solute:sodium symporter family transporter [Aquimarina sp. BL5]AXT53853.1 solute:sodium symporter family transporter [Aquimarina sp. BL5]RKN02730.1 solute:sodium symporter family transporter [Aquimarina sp. BL5]
MGIISFVGFTLLVAIISYLATRKTDETSSDGYFLGGRSLTAVVIAGSLLLTNLSTEQIVGLNGSSYSEGILVMAWETLAAIAMVITAIFLLPRYLKGGITTVPQFLERRYDTTTKAITSGLFLTGYVVVFLPIVLYSGSLAISTMFDVPELLGVSKEWSIIICVIGIGVIGSIYAIFGGLKAVAVSDTINAVGLLIGGIMIPVFGLLEIGDGSISEGINTLMTTNPEKFKVIGDSDSSIPFATIFTGMMLVQLFYWGTNQAIIQRALGAKNLKEGQKGLLLGSFLKILGPIIVVLPGIIAFHLFNGELEVADEAYPTLVSRVLPVSLVGFFAAVLFGAILSSFNSALNSSVTLFGLDIYKEYINKEASEKQVVKAGKSFGVLLAILAMAVAPFIAKAGSLFDYLQEVNGIYSIPILTIIVVGYLTKKVPAIAGKIGIISGSVLYIISQFIIKPILQGNAVEAAKANGITDLVELGRIETSAYPHFLHVMAILFVVNIIIMLIIGKLYPREEAYEQQYTKEVDITPWKYTKIVGAIVCLIVISTYIYFN